jgi:ketosteroid isomerase-like protein
MAIRGTNVDGGGAYEIAYGVVGVVENGQVARWERYGPGDRQAMIARYAELGGGQAPLGDRPPERLIREFGRCAAARDVDGVVALYADDVDLIDHRRLGWDEHGPDDVRARLSGYVDSAPTFYVRVDEVLACDERVIAVLLAACGEHRDGGGAFEVAIGWVAVVENGRLVRMERYEPDDRQAMLARFAELTGSPRPAPGDRRAERCLREAFRVVNARDVKGFLAAFADDHVSVDHRRLGWEDETSNVEATARLEAFFAASADVRLEIDEVLAGDDRVVATSISVRGTSDDGGGPFEIVYGMVCVLEDGVLTRTERFDADERPAMISRYVELGGGHAALGDRPPERAYRRMLRLIARRDFDALFNDFITDDYVMADHRTLAWTETDKAGERRVVESMFAAALDVRLEVDEVLACNDRVIAALHIFRGHSTDGGGEFEIATGMVMEIVDGKMRRADRYEEHDRDAMLARYAEMSGKATPVLGDRPPERLMAEVCRRWAARGLDRLLELYAPDYVTVDHRPLGWDVTDKDGTRPMVEAMLAAQSNGRFEVREVLACDDRVMALTISMCGTSNDGGGAFEIPNGVVVVVENGLLCRLDRYQPEDRQALIARYTELGGGLAALGDQPPERYFAEYLRRAAARDVDGFMAMFADDVVIVEHRSLGWDETDKADVRARIEAFLASAPEFRGEVEQVLACDDRVLAGIYVIRGTSVDGGGLFEIWFGMVSVIEDGLQRRQERFDAKDRQAMMARYAELTADR